MYSKPTTTISIYLSDVNVADIVLIALLVYGAYKGFTKGLILQVASLVALVLGAWGAIEFSFYTEGLLGDQTNIDDSYVPILAFALTFAVIVIAVHLLARVLEKVISLAALSLVNKLLGLVFGVLKVALVVSFILVVVNSLDEKWNFVGDANWRKESKLYEPISNLGPMILPVVEDNHWYKDYIKEYVEDEPSENVEL